MINPVMKTMSLRNHCPHILALAFIMAFPFCAGCGGREADEKRLDEIREKSRKELARLESRLKEYDSRVREYESEIASLKGELAVFRADRSEEAPPAAPAAEPSPPALREAAAVIPTVQDRRTAAAPAGGEQEPGIDSLVAEFTTEYGASVEKGSRERFKSDFEAFAASMKARQEGEPAPISREEALENLRDRIAAATDPREKAILEQRLQRIEGASEADLPGVLDYFDRLDSNQRLRELMDEYNISRKDLAEFGIEPPPRSNWGPDVREIADNLESFVDLYAPVVEEGMREQYRGDFNEYISKLNRIWSEGELNVKREEMISSIREQYATATEENRARLERRVRRLEGASPERLRQIVQYETLREMNLLADKYGIPRSELRQSGIYFPRRRSSGR